MLALALLGGSILIMSLSILGWGLKTPVAELYKSAHRYLNAAVIALLITGVLLGISEPVKLYGRQAFWVKMISLGVALLVTYFAFNPLVRRGASGVRRALHNGLDHRGMADGGHGGTVDRIFLIGFGSREFCP